jgi:glutamate 5-kinase
LGIPILIRQYQKEFSAYGIPVAQALCERQHFSDRGRFLQLKETFNVFWENGILPIMNENDLVSNVELKFSDNDELATLTAIGFDAGALLLCTSVGRFAGRRGSDRSARGKGRWAGNGVGASRARAVWVWEGCCRSSRLRGWRHRWGSG